MDEQLFQVGGISLPLPCLINRYEVSIWPFHGRFYKLIRKEHITIVETYPAEACLHVGLKQPGRGWSKRSQSDRIALSNKLFEWVSRRNVALSPLLESEIYSGFGDTKDAEDRFDSVIGLFSMIETVLGYRETGEPDMPSVRSLEGWIFGQSE